MWDDRYNQAEFVYGKEPNDFLRQHFQHIPAGGHVLCLAEGEGRNAVFLARQGYHVTAVDLSGVGLKKAKAFAEENGVDLVTVVADLAEYDLGTEIWDGIVSIWAHLPEKIRQQLHHKVERALKPNGVFILEAYTLEHLNMAGKGGPPPSQPGSFMSLKQLAAELPTLQTIIATETQRDVQEGKMHQGPSAVVQLVARK